MLPNFIEVKSYGVDSSVRINPASMPRSNVLRDLVYGSGFIKRLAKSLLPGEGLRKTLTGFINTVNMIPFEKPVVSL
jgi:hypothetical protein